MNRLRRLRTAVGGSDGQRGKFQRTPLIGVGGVVCPALSRFLKLTITEG
jgi:hypothetical protein